MGQDVYATCSGLNTAWASWALPLPGTSGHLATLCFNWGSRAGVWAIASAVPVTDSHDRAGIQDLRGGGCSTWHHLNRARPDLPVPLHTYIPKCLETSNFPVYHSHPVARGIDQDHSNGSSWILILLTEEKRKRSLKNCRQGVMQTRM